MNCKDVEKLVRALARHQIMDRLLGEQSLVHTAHCKQCAARLMEERALLAGVRAVVSEINQEEAPARVETALLEAFRAQQTRLPISAAPRALPVKTAALHWQRGAIAAGLLILLSLAVFSWQSRSLRPLPEAPAIASATAGASAIDGAPPLVQPELQKPVAELAPVQGARRPAPRRQNLASKPEVVTEFFSLTEADELEALENGQIVRVELQGAALLEVGLPVDVAMVNESIKADVVLGPDGLARAIRFVRQ